MSNSVIEISPLVAQSPTAVTQPKNPWMYTSLGLVVLFFLLGIVSQLQFAKVR